MKRILFAAITLAAVLFLAGGAMAEQAKIEVAGGKRIYLVKPGDTLSGIAGSVFGDPGRWRELWKLNPQVKKAGLIYPGDALVIGDAEVEAADIGVRQKETPDEAMAQADDREIMAAQFEELPPVVAPQELVEPLPEETTATLQFRKVDISEAPSITKAIYEECGYITDALPEAAIIASAEKKSNLTFLDTVFINRGSSDGISVGQEFRVLHPVRRVKHPKTAIQLGQLVEVVGRAKVVCLQEKTATAEIIYANNCISIGDRLEPYVPTVLPRDRYLSSKLQGPCLPKAKGGVTIVATRHDKINVGEGDIVYLDKGLEQGLVPGQRLAVARTVHTNTGAVQTLAGELQVLASRQTTATALVTNSIYNLSASDLVIVW